MEEDQPEQQPPQTMTTEEKIPLVKGSSGETGSGSSTDDREIAEPQPQHMINSDQDKWLAHRAQLYASYWRCLGIAGASVVALAAAVAVVALLWLRPAIHADAATRRVQCSVARVLGATCETVEGAEGARFTLWLTSCIDRDTPLSSSASGCDTGISASGKTIDPTCWEGWSYKVGMRVPCFYDARRVAEESLSFLRPRTTSAPIAVLVSMSLVLLMSLGIGTLFSALLPQAIRLRSVFKGAGTPAKVK